MIPDRGRIGTSKIPLLQTSGGCLVSRTVLAVGFRHFDNRTVLQTKLDDLVAQFGQSLSSLLLRDNQFDLEDYLV